jgi:arylsulfatase A-like enzyme
VRTSQTVSLIDTAPTILDLLGLPADDRYQGTTALTSDARMAFFYADYSLEAARTSRREHEIHPRAGFEPLAPVRSGRDPLESYDIATAQADYVYWYSQRLRSGQA